MRSDDHNMSSHCSQVFLLLIERSVCWVQNDDCANLLYIGEHISLVSILYLSSVIEYKLEGEFQYRFSASCCSQGFLLHFE